VTKLKSPLELYKFLNKSNCRKCMLPSCMAFAGAVFQNQKQVTDCPDIDLEAIGELAGDFTKSTAPVDEQQQILNGYRSEIENIDLAAAAKRLNAPIRDDAIVINCLGKDFKIDATGDMASECHKNAWVQVPVLNYILYSKGLEPKGDWRSFGELSGAEDWSQFFSHSCELEMAKLADAHTELFFELLHLFGAKEIPAETNSDHSLVIFPLPLVPIIINYWEAEDSFDSKLNMLFDQTAEDNLNAEYIYTLCRGIIEMFRELLVKHSKDGKLF